MQIMNKIIICFIQILSIISVNLKNKQKNTTPINIIKNKVVISIMIILLYLDDNSLSCYRIFQGYCCLK